MRYVRRLSIVVGLMGLVLLPATGAQASHQHLHCITTPSGNTHSIAQGVTFMASHTAFSNLHQHVHLGAFATNPIPITADAVEPFNCPPG